MPDFIRSDFPRADGDLPARNSTPNCIGVTRWGPMIFNRNDRYIGRSLEVYGEFSRGEAELFEAVIRTGDHCLDIGANIGVHTVRLAQLAGHAGKVLAIEPQIHLFHLLLGNVAINNLFNVRGLSAVFSSARGQTMYVPQPDYHQYDESFGGVAMSSVPIAEAHIRETISIDSLCLDRLDFVKVDVEGMESHVIEGGLDTITKFLPILYIENDRIEHSKGLIELLWEIEYSLYWHTPPLFSPDNFNGVPDNLFPGLYSANLLCLPYGSRGREINISQLPVTMVCDSAFHPFDKSVMA